MQSFDKEDKRPLEASQLAKGTLPRVDPRSVQSEPSAYDIVTTVVPATQRLPLPELEKPERKTTLLRGLCSQVVEEFQGALDSLKDHLRFGSEKFFWPVVLEVLSTPGDRQHFASRIAANATHMETLPEVFLISLLETLDSAAHLAPRKLRCRGRILAEMVWLVPHSCSHHISNAIDSDPRVLRPFAVSLVSAGGPLEVRGVCKYIFKSPPTFLCRYLIQDITDAIAGETANRAVLLSGGALQLASSCSTSLTAINAVLSGRSRPTSTPSSFTLLEGVLHSYCMRSKIYPLSERARDIFVKRLSVDLRTRGSEDPRRRLASAAFKEALSIKPQDELFSASSAHSSLKLFLYDSSEETVSGKLREELFSRSSSAMSLRLFSEAVYQWAEVTHEGGTDEPDRMAKASLLTEEIVRSIPHDEYRPTPRDRDLAVHLLRFSSSRSASSAAETAKCLITGTRTPELTPSQEAAFAFIGNELANDPHGELSKHFASQYTWRAFLGEPEEMQRLAGKVKKVIEEEAQKRSSKVQTWLSAARLHLLSSAQRHPPAIGWWTVLALLDTEEMAAPFVHLWRKQTFSKGDSQAPQKFLDTMASFLPRVKTPQDLKGSFEFWCAPETKKTLESLTDWAFSKRGSRLSAKERSLRNQYYGPPLIDWSDRNEHASELRHEKLLSYFLTRDLRDCSALDKLRELIAVLEEVNPEELLAFMRLPAQSPQTVPWLGPKEELQTYHSFLQIFGPIHHPTLYNAYRTLRAGAPWGAFKHLDDLFAYRLNLLNSLCHDAVDSTYSNPLELELFDQVCHLSLNTFADKRIAIAQMRNWSDLSKARRDAYDNARAPSPPPGSDRRIWREHHAAARRAEAAWKAFTTVGQHSVNLTVRKFVPHFEPPRISTDWAIFLDPSFVHNLITRDYQALVHRLPSRDFLADIPTPLASDKAEVFACQRKILRAMIESGPPAAATHREIEEHRQWVSVMTLRIFCSAPEPGQKRYLRYDPALDEQTHALLWADIGAGLFEGTLADEYIFRDVNWSAERRHEFLKRLRAALPYDEMVEALERHSATAQSHPRASDLGESCTLTMIPTRGIARELSGHLFDVCWATNENAFSSVKGVDDGRQNIIGVTFVRDYNTPKATIVGGSLVVVGYATENPQQPVMIIRGCNPRSSFLNRIYSGEFFDQWVSYLSQVAQVGSTEIAIPADPVPFLALTNQPDLFYYARNNYFSGSPLDVSSVTLTEFNGIRVGNRLRRIEVRP
jgi:hypothetical protein